MAISHPPPEADSAIPAIIPDPQDSGMLACLPACLLADWLACLLGPLCIRGRPHVQLQRLHMLMWDIGLTALSQVNR